MSTFLDFIYLLYLVFLFAMVIRAALSWFAVRPDNPLVIFIYQITEPILAPLRRVVPRIGLLDVTPIVAVILLYIVVTLLDVLLS